MSKLALGALIFSAVISARAQTPRDAPYVTAAQIQAALEDAPHDRNSDRAIRVTDVGTYRIGIFAVFAPKAAPISAVAHQTDSSETYYILDGAGVLVTGGALRKPIMPRQSKMGNWKDLISSGVEGGLSQRVIKGDVVVIPGRVPHGWASVEDDITYLIIRYDPKNQIPVK